jgi:restriction endonuclease
MLTGDGTSMPSSSLSAMRNINTSTPWISSALSAAWTSRAKRGVFVAPARFSPPALKLAAARHLEAVDDAKLMQLVRKAFPEAERIKA